MVRECDEQRRAVAALDTEALTGVGDLRLPAVSDRSDPAWHIYALRTSDPEALGAHMREHGIGSGRHYPVPVHLTGAYAHLGHSACAFPGRRGVGAQQFSLPIFPGMTDAQVDAQVDAVRDFFVRH